MSLSKMSVPFPSIIQAFWNNTTRSLWISSGETNKLHSDKSFNCYPIGTIVLLIDKDEECIFGVSVMSSKCRIRDLLDIDVYTGSYAKYNKYECDVKTRMFLEPILCKDVSEMCHADPAKQSWYYHLAFRSCFMSGDKTSENTRNKFTKLVKTWIN